MKSVALCAAAFAFTLATSTVDAEKPGVTVAPFDEATLDAGFLAFRNQLRQIVESRDVAGLTAVLDEEILNSFGGNGGIAEFHAMWRTQSPDSPLWKTLKRVLDHGGCLDEEGEVKTFMAPYVWCIVVNTELLDGYDSALVIDKDAPLLAEASVGAKVLERPGFSAVRILGWPGEEGQAGGYYQVETGAGNNGFMPEMSVSASLGYRAIFEQRDGRWVMTTFVAGD